MRDPKANAACKLAWARVLESEESTAKWERKSELTRQNRFLPQQPLALLDGSIQEASSSALVVAPPLDGSAGSSALVVSPPLDGSTGAIVLASGATVPCPPFVPMQLCLSNISSLLALANDEPVQSVVAASIEGGSTTMPLDPDIIAAIIAPAAIRNNCKGQLSPFLTELKLTTIGRRLGSTSGCKALEKIFDRAANSIPGKPATPVPAIVTYQKRCSSVCKECSCDLAVTRSEALTLYFYRLACMTPSGKPIDIPKVTKPVTVCTLNTNKIGLLCF